jgi:hypothetical protein
VAAWQSVSFGIATTGRLSPAAFPCRLSILTATCALAGAINRACGAWGAVVESGRGGGYEAGAFAAYVHVAPTMCARNVWRGALGNAMTQKILWVVNYGALDDFLARVVAIGADGVAIRSDNDLEKAIPAFAARGIKVYAWRWPSAMRDPAMKEARKIAELYAKGLDGYFIDVEGALGKPHDWDQKGLDQLAEDFCTTITSAAAGKRLGLTSHYRAAQAYPNLPWASFLEHADVLLPQAYWRTSTGPVGHGLPGDNYVKSFEFWKSTGGDTKRIVPMGGELAASSIQDIAAYARAATMYANELHFYTAEAAVRAPIWNAIAKL